MLGVAAYLAVCMLLSLAVAMASYHLYEKHFLRLKAFFSSTFPALENRNSKIKNPPAVR